MGQLLRRRKFQVLAVVVLVPFLIVFGFSIYLANMAGALPWQTDPTRISDSIQPFSGIPGFNSPTPTPTRVATAVILTPTSVTAP